MHVGGTNSARVRLPKTCPGNLKFVVSGHYLFNTRTHTHTHTHRLQCPVTLRTVEDGDHRLSRPQDIDILLQALNELLHPEAARRASEVED